MQPDKVPGSSDLTVVILSTTQLALVLYLYISAEYEKLKTIADKIALDAPKEGVPMVSVFPGVMYGPGKITLGNVLARTFVERLNGRLPGYLGDGNCCTITTTNPKFDRGMLDRELYRAQVANTRDYKEPTRICTWDEGVENFPKSNRKLLALQDKLDTS
ncbi:NAD-dependent epimerase/dehydratase [Tanacetum coccineum]